ncbi:uncharacterized membrane protein YoaK (UPF0700 family) [Pullulanibacillus pueri]|uniref:DUF1275 domain-containing protein n=1 Tax=Pullulanibacillus pueri TaxID=1437324 RepID=A0A8J2ZU08_9BACL|nr:YoaK family protein [Pullulanibacillus pueri]MBM7681278.1 uncharacterized membrane protein YoaK (UPF0700 family) [Pullulanibacillus pueri]GGH77771.1 hypothetical protein GCM10007096_10160 [Pullulanibacillus pueri]
MTHSKKTLNLIVLLLTMISGCSDAISFLALGEVLTAAMTGNTVFFGLSLVNAKDLAPLGYLVALLGFMLGVAVGAFVLRHKRHVTGLNTTVLLTLCIEFIGLALFGLLVSFVTSPNHYLLIVLLALSMGVQGTTARRLGVNGVPTTVITSTTTGMIESLVWKAHNSMKKNTTDGPVNAPLASWSSVSMWFIDIVIYGVGAALCGLLELHWGLHAIWMPVCIIVITFVLSLSYTSTQKVSNQNPQM